MTRVFIGGSRSVTRLDADVARRLDAIMAKGHGVLIGDANGADKAVQQYLHAHGYAKVEVFCTEGRCRNNVGQWPIRTVDAGRKRRGFQYYAAKDRCMASEASAGLMIWDGTSAGTLANVARLACQGKTVTLRIVSHLKSIRLCIVSDLKSVSLSSEPDWQRFVVGCPVAARERVESELKAEKAGLGSETQTSLF